MRLLNKTEFEEDIRKNYTLILTNDSSNINDNYPGRCDFCNRDVYLKIYSRWNRAVYDYSGLPSFCTFFIQCPSCLRQSFISAIVLSILKNNKYEYEHYKLYQLPTQNIVFETADIPVEFELLKKTVVEAKANLANKLYMSATIMYRRALQILAKDVLGAKGKSLFNQLEWLKNNQNILQINLTELFHDNSSLIRQVGNQGAHPDEDIDLQEFTADDANAVHDLFLLLINEIFVLPEKMRQMKKELAERRKLN